MTTTEKLDQFLAAIAQRTKQGDLVWQDTADEDTFHVSLRSGSLRIRRREEQDPSDGELFYLYRVTVIDREGRVVEEVERGGSQLGELYDLGRRSARKTDKVLDELLAEVQAQG